MSTTPNVPESQESYHGEPSPFPRWVLAIFIVLFVLVGYLLYARKRLA
ncbi:MAG: hypothetical protein HY237_01520 [Acidobacteria bacterium]|nr:hypothetical protein [Acidobacteriota bacterium]